MNNEFLHRIRHLVLLSAGSLVLACGGSQSPVSPQIPSPEQPHEQPEPESSSSQAKYNGTAEEIGRAFVDWLQTGKYEVAASHMNEKMRAAINSKDLARGFSALTDRVGLFIEQDGVVVHEANKFQVALVNTRFKKARVAIRVVVDENGKVAGLWYSPPVFPWKPPAYTNIESFEELEVTVGEGEWSLPGSLTLPKGEGPFPGVVLVHGSGPSDRDETSGSNKTFKDLAYGLSSRGIAVLRYDKRTLIHGVKTNGEAFTPKQEYVDDALSGLSLLKANAKIDRKLLFVLGHSAGAMAAPRIAQASSDVKGIVLLAGATREFGEIFMAQREYIFGLDGKIDDQENGILEDARKRIAALTDEKLSSETPSSSLPYGISAEYWLDMFAHNPVTIAKKLNTRILVLQGERDYQVTMEDFEGWKKALSRKRRVSFKSYPKLNHHFMEGNGVGPSTPAEYSIPGHVEEQVIKDVSDWIIG